MFAARDIPYVALFVIIEDCCLAILNITKEYLKKHSPMAFCFISRLWNTRETQIISFVLDAA
jgi:hypothetical protein